MINSNPMSGYNLENIKQTSAFFYINNNIYFNSQKLWSQIYGAISDKRKDVVGESPSRYRIDFGLKYLLCNKKLSIGIEYQNMLASHEKSIIKSNGITYIYDYKPYRVLNISISYQFGKKLNVHPKKSE